MSDWNAGIEIGSIEHAFGYKLVTPRVHHRLQDSLVRDARLFNGGLNHVLSGVS